MHSNTMHSKFYSHLRASLLLSAGLSLGLAALIPVAEARIISNSTLLNGSNLKIKRDASVIRLGPVPTNGTLLNGTTLKIDAALTSRLQLEGSQLVLHSDR